MLASHSSSVSKMALLALLTFPTACGSDSASGGDSGAGGAQGAATGGTKTGSGGSAAGGSHGGQTAGGGTGGNAVHSALPVDLGSAGDYVILAKTGISTVPTSAVTGNVGVSPAAATYITGFSLTADATNSFASSTQITGKVYAANYASPTPANMTAAIGDMEHAFDDAAGRAADVTELGAGNIGGRTLEGGVYAWGTGVTIPTDLTLAGDETSVWIFQIAKGLTVSSAVNIVLEGGALPQNVFWEVAGKVDIGTTAHFEGIVLCSTSVKLGTGASIDGRLLSQTAVTIDGSTVVQP